MKLLLDQGTPRSAAERLRQAGTDAIHVGDIGQASADDAAMLEDGAAVTVQANRIRLPGCRWPAGERFEAGALAAGEDQSQYVAHSALHAGPK